MASDHVVPSTADAGLRTSTLPIQNEHATQISTEVTLPTLMPHIWGQILQLAASPQARLVCHQFCHEFDANNNSLAVKADVLPQPCFPRLLSRTPQLQQLVIRDGQGVTDLTPLAACTGLQQVDLAGCVLLVDLAPLAACTGLKRLNLQDCENIASLIPLSACTGLQQLDLAYCELVADLAPLAACTGLQELDLAFCTSVASLAPLAACTGLQQLDLTYWELMVDLGPLAACTGLQELTLRYCKSVADLSPLAACSGLRQLDLTDCESVADLAPLAACTELQRLDLHGCTAVADLAPLAACTGLEKLCLWSCPDVTDLSPLASCLVLTQLEAGVCTGVTTLAACISLRQLNLRGCKSVTDLSPLAACTGLQELDLTGCPVVDNLGPLAACKEIEQLALDHVSWDASGFCRAADLTPLASCTRLQGLRMWDVATGAPKNPINVLIRNVISVAISSDGTAVVAGTNDGEIRLLDVESGECIGLAGDTSSVQGIAIHPDKSTIVSGGSAKHNFQRLLTWQQEYEEHRHSRDRFSIAISPDGKSIACGSGCAVGETNGHGVHATVRLRDLESGRTIRDIWGNNVNSVAFSPDGQTIAYAHGNLCGSCMEGQYPIRLWNLSSGTCTSTPEWHTEPVSDVAFTPDGKLVVSADKDNTILVWDVASGECIHDLEGHADNCDGVTSVAISPDGKTIVSGAGDKTIRLWDLESGDCIHVLEGHAECVECVAISPDGKTIASVSYDKTIRLWDLESNTCKAVLEGHTKGVECISISPDGKIMASGGYDKTVRVWELASHKCIGRLEEDSAVLTVAFTPDGKRLVTGTAHRTIRAWDLPVAELEAVLAGPCDSPSSAAVGQSSTIVVRPLIWQSDNLPQKRDSDWHTEAVPGVAISGDGSTLVTGSHDNTVRVWRYTAKLSGDISWLAVTPDGSTVVSDSGVIRVWDVATGECRSLPGTGTWFAPAMSPDGKTLVTACRDDNTVKVWDPQSCECKKTLQGHTGDVQSLAFSSDGNAIITSAEDKTVRVWDLASGECRRVIDISKDEPGQGEDDFSIRTNGRIILSWFGEVIRVWDSESGECQSTLEGHTGYVYDTGISPDGKSIVSAASDRTLRIWDALSGACKHILDGHKDSVRSLTFTPDGETFVSADNKTIKVWHLEGGQCKHVLQGLMDMVDPSGKSLIMTSDDSFRVVDLGTGQVTKTLPESFGPVAMSQDRKTLITGEPYTTIRVWDLESGECKRMMDGMSSKDPDDKLVRIWEHVTTLSGHSDWVTSVAVSHDGKTVVSGSLDKTIKIWDVGSSVCVLTLKGARAPVLSVATSSDGKMIVSGEGRGPRDKSQGPCNRSVRVWDLILGELKRELQGHTGDVNSVAISSDGTTIITGSDDSTIRVWDLESGACRLTLTVDRRRVKCLALSPDGRTIISGSIKYKPGECIEATTGTEGDSEEENEEDPEDGEDSKDEAGNGLDGQEEKELG